jgi:hypothetical protein
MQPHGIIPKGLLLKNPINIQHSSVIVQHARKALLRGRIHFCCHNKVYQLQRIQQLLNFLKSVVSNSDQHHTFTDVESSSRNNFNKEWSIFVNFHSSMISITQSLALTYEFTEFVLDLSELVPTYFEEAVLQKGLNFLSFPHLNLDVTSTVKSIVLKLS